MPSYQWPDKDPGDTLDYDADFSGVLPDADNIDSVVWAVDPSGGSHLNIEAQSHDDPTQTATVWFSGGVDGTDYTVTCTVTTDSAPVNRVVERDIGLNVRNIV